MKKRNIQILFPDFPANNKASYLQWANTLDKYLEKNIINENTIIISRCLGSRFILKYIAQKNIKVKAFISIAAFLEDNVGIPETDLVLRKFHVSEEEINKSINLINLRFAIYGDKDYLSILTRLENFANKIKATKLFVKGMGHCGNSSGIKRIPHIVEIIDEIVNYSI